MAKALSALQERVLSLLIQRGVVSDGAYVLSGGTALSEYHLGHRQSDDLDFFSRHRADVRPDVQGVAEALREAGYAVELEQRSDAFARVLLRSPTSEELILDFGLEYHPLEPPRHVDDVVVDSYRDMAARKLVAFFERGDQEAKDAVDLYFLLTQGGWTMERLIADARQKTADLDHSDGLLELARLLIRSADAPYLDRMRRLRFLGEAPNVLEVGRRLRQEGERLVLGLRPLG
ncbi:MAG: nucleotidyl transferase AbiEii/AbiGii toxin family protein [Armatimonadetes bacterium]|nr:nucleotidyl transferase AbiEii/AbiGii toxin family protein [Armatimonadota bacterium]